MQEQSLQEKNFESDIEQSLITAGGYIKGNPHDFNRETALDEKTLLAFIRKTQERAWEKHRTNYPDNPEQALLRRFQQEVSESGLLYVLRHGFKDRGVAFKVCYFKPETNKNADTAALYAQNILHCTRQLKFSPTDERSIDIVLFLNGIPVVSMELKNQFTGQNVQNAINQYRFDRATKEKLFEFKQRVLVHFAVDLYNVHMTTRLQGASTCFLPFNQGSNGAGNVGGKGNPDKPEGQEGYITSYLWEKVLTKDSLLEILQKYMQLQKETVKDKSGTVSKYKETMIFPRYHQLDVVTKLLRDVKENGSGKNYLIQHSAGSGKSNSIAWLAHRLAGLHDKTDTVVFHSVVIVTDRKILDSQLQETVYQFDHVDGVVQRIDKNSAQLKDAINSNAKIIVTTLQKFPVIYQEVEASGKRFAVIVDEAHSSQTGTAAKKLKEALGNTEEILEQFAKEEAEEENSREDFEDRLVKDIAVHGQHKNLSFFAFTATPKNKTLQVFGTKDEEGKYRPFHVYSMRQAIEEGFILDVLSHYVTYRQYYKIAKSIAGDPEYDKTKGSRAVARFQSLHPHNIAQKTTVMIEHFMQITKNKIGGKAKAMVVTASRLHAVRYLFEFRRYLKEHGYTDLDVLVAFSGSVKDGGEEWTEEKINKNKQGQNIKESQLKQYFKEDFNVLIVAEKYQTGFDEPLLHTMFVDKKLNGVKAVQTLSRLNRIYRGKEDTFVLDFANTADEMRKSFQPFYEATALYEETDPNTVYTIKKELDGFRIYSNADTEQFAKKYYQKSTPSLAALSSLLKPAADKYEALEDEEKSRFKSKLHAFCRLYAFITQICRIFDKDLQKFYVYAKFLTKIIKDENSESINLDDKLLLEYYKLTKTSEGAVQLEKQGEVNVPSVQGGGNAAALKEKEPLSEIIDKFNKRFSTEYSEMDKVLAQLKNDLKENTHIYNAAKSNDITKFKALYDKLFQDMAFKRYQENDKFFQDLFSDENKLNFIKKELLEYSFKEIKEEE